MLRTLHPIRRYAASRKYFSSKTEPTENEPIKFTSSEAFKTQVRPLVRKVNPNNMPWYQPYSVVVSISVFMIYFCMLREENDVDVEFTKTLYERIKGLEKEQLVQSYKFNKDHGKSVADIEVRLKELEVES